MQGYAPLQLERIALHLNTFVQKRKAIPQDVFVQFQGRSHILHSLFYHNRRIYAELVVTGQGVLFEAALTKAEAANIALEVLAQAEAEVCAICQTWVATHTVQVGNVAYHVCDKPQCQDEVSTLVIQQRVGETL